MKKKKKQTSEYGQVKLKQWGEMNKLIINILFTLKPIVKTS